MNKKVMMLLLVVTFVLTVGAVPAFAAENMTDKQVMMAADKVLKMAPDNKFFRLKLEDLKMKVDSGAMDFVIVDVRPITSFKKDHIAGSISVPLPTLVDNLNMIPKNKPVYVVCGVDTVSSYVAFALRMFGYDAYMVPGGEVAWKQAGYPVVSDMAK